MTTHRDTELVERCPFCNWPASAMMDTGTKVWRVYCHDDGTCGDDAPGCCAEGPEAMTESEAIALWNKRPAIESQASLIRLLESFAVTVTGVFPHLVAGLRVYPEALANVEEGVAEINEAIDQLKGKQQ